MSLAVRTSPNWRPSRQIQLLGTLTQGTVLSARRQVGRFVSSTMTLNQASSSVTPASPERPQLYGGIGSPSGH